MLQRKLFAAFILFVPLLVFAQEDRLTLANKYLDLRGSTWGWGLEEFKSQMTDAERAKLVEGLFDGVIDSHPKSKRWTPGHPARKQLREKLNPELARLGDLVSKPQDPALASKVKLAFVRGVAAAFTEKELQDLIAYYSLPQGRVFIASQKTLNDMVQSSLKARQTTADTNVQYPRQTKVNQEKLLEILGLFDEVARIQIGILDPGPDGDRTGLQGVRMMISAGVVDVYPELNLEWEKIPEPDRLEMLTWRKSAKGQNEREALYKAAGNIRTVYKPEEGAQEVLRASAELAAKSEYLIDRLAPQFP